MQVNRISGLLFSVEIRPNFGDEGVGVQYSRAIRYSVSLFCPPLSVRLELQCWGSMIMSLDKFIES